MTSALPNRVFCIPEDCFILANSKLQLSIYSKQSFDLLDQFELLGYLPIIQ